MQFKTDFVYSDRKTKQEYVWRKYQSILEGASILDVGADECFLKEYLQSTKSYFGIGLGGNPDLEYDLELGTLPFEDRKFDVVICLDVLEHLEQIHAIFDECCRVAGKYFILSLPNPFFSIYGAVCFQEYRPGRLTKFYGLPHERPADRHRWFFTAEEARSFVEYRAKKNNFGIVQMDHETGNHERNFLRKWARNLLFRRDFNQKNCFESTLWAILERK